MTENVVLYVMILRLKQILPLENYRFIEQESLKLFQ